MQLVVRQLPDNKILQYFITNLFQTYYINFLSLHKHHHRLISLNQHSCMTSQAGQKTRHVSCGSWVQGATPHSVMLACAESQGPLPSSCDCGQSSFSCCCWTHGSLLIQDQIDHLADLNKSLKSLLRVHLVRSGLPNSMSNWWKILLISAKCLHLCHWMQHHHESAFHHIYRFFLQKWEIIESINTREWESLAPS